MLLSEMLEILAMSRVRAICTGSPRIERETRKAYTETPAGGILTLHQHALLRIRKLQKLMAAYWKILRALEAGMVQV